MNPHTLNGERLMEQGRPSDAVGAFRKALAMNPDDGHAHAMLALASLQCKDIDAAQAAITEALRLMPANPFPHYVQGFICLADHKLDQAERAAQEAITLQPDAPEFYRLLALVWYERRDFDKALEVIDRGLALDPESSDCLNVRSQVLVRLRRTGEARSMADAALASNPDDAYSHANAGWSALHNNKTKEALGHFKESLRLDPGNDWAKAGLAEALKARNPLYRLLLGFILWMVRLKPGVRIGVIVGGFVLYRIADGFAENNPAVAPFVWPLLIAYIAFAWMTWIGVPLADLTLRLSPYGRHALSDRQRLVSSVLGLFMLAALCSLGLYLLAKPGVLGPTLQTHADSFTGAAMQIAALALITVGVLQAHRAPRYKPLLAGCGVLALLVLGNWYAVAVQNVPLAEQTDRLFMFGFIGMMWFVGLGGAGTPRNAFS